jgi:hypothetical protein
MTTRSHAGRRFVDVLLPPTRLLHKTFLTEAQQQQQSKYNTFDITKTCHTITFGNISRQNDKTADRFLLAYFITSGEYYLRANPTNGNRSLCRGGP